MKRLLIVMTLLFLSVLSAYANDLEPTPSTEFNDSEMTRLLKHKAPRIATDVVTEKIELARKGK